MSEPRDQPHQDRERGLLKRVRGTPLPARVFVAGRVGNSLVISLLMVVAGRAHRPSVYGVEIPVNTLPARARDARRRGRRLLLPGLRADGDHPHRGCRPGRHQRRGAPAVLHLRHLHSGQRDPGRRPHFADLFPIRHFFEAFFTAWDPNTAGAGSSGGTSRSSPPGGSRGSSSPSRVSAGSRGAESAGSKHLARERVDQITRPPRDLPTPGTPCRQPPGPRGLRARGPARK